MRDAYLVFYKVGGLLESLLHNVVQYCDCNTAQTAILDIEVNTLSDLL